MLRSLKEILGCIIRTQDGEMGKVHDFHFEDDSWTVRYLVADTDGWLGWRKVLLTPQVLGTFDRISRRLSVSLTKEQMRKSPDLYADMPVSRQKEIELHQHDDWQALGTPVNFEPSTTYAPASSDPGKHPRESQTKTVPQLQSMRAVAGYYLHATDGRIGHVADLIADEDSWCIRYLAVDTHNWLPGRRVLILPIRVVQELDWGTREVYVGLTREKIRGSPPCDPKVSVSREFETALYEYYGLPAYWTKPESKIQTR